jgi:tetratricopeptide (TPR) repeat protein
MKIPFNSSGRRRLVALVAVVLATAYVGLAASRFAASWLSTRTDQTSLRRAATLDPGNAEYRDLLGQYDDLIARDPHAAIAHYREAVALNPHSSRYWFDLSSAYQVVEDPAGQASALEHAIKADAMTPDVAWEAGNFFLVRGENEKALHEFRVVIANDPSLGDAALQFCWRIKPDVDVLLREVLPARAEAYAGFLDLLETKKDTPGAAKVWDALIETHQSFKLQTAYDYIRYSVSEKDVDRAVLAWQQIAPRFALTSYLPSTGNLVVNGNFDLNILNGGFDWQYQKQSSVNLMLDPSDFHGGRRSLLITFDGPGIVEAGIFQLVAVQPKTTYNFSAYYKNGEMEGAGGPHFTVQDMYSQAVYYESEELRESGFWKSANGEFTTGPDCKLVVLHIRRLPAGSPMRGKLWVDDFHITPKNS